MSATDLAQRVEEAVTRGALVTEGETTVSVSNLASVDAQKVATAAVAAGLACSIRDAEGQDWPAADLVPEFQPFRVSVTKPVLADGTLAVVTGAGFEHLLAAGTAYNRWWVAGLTAPIRTWTTLFLPWGDDEAAPSAIPTANPRTLVREYSSERSVPASIGRWLLRRDETIDLNVAICRIWAEAAVSAIMLALPNEVEDEQASLRFRGPPRLSLRYERTAIGPAERQVFADLETAAAWVFENERETELRHTLLATEIARSGGDGTVLSVFGDRLAPSLEGARIAYELSVAGTSADTLKALADLRKAVTEEMAKVTEATRQTITAVTGAIAVGMGLLAARSTTKTEPWLIEAVMVVAVVYVLLILATGAQFVLLQRSVRSDWQVRLYRFLPSSDYRKLVTKPAFRAEFAFWSAATIGVFATIALAWTVLHHSKTATGLVPDGISSPTTVRVLVGRGAAPAKPVPSGPQASTAARHLPSSTGVVAATNSRSTN